MNKNASTPLILSLLLLLSSNCVLAFVVSSKSQSSSTRLFGIAEWRNLQASSLLDDTTKPLAIIPFPSNQVLLQGQTKYLHFRDQVHLDIFQQALQSQEGLFGMGLLMHDGESIVSTVPLLEIQDYNSLSPDMGTFVKVRAVGRARVTQVLNDTTALVQEVFDDIESTSALQQTVKEGDDAFFQELYEYGSAYEEANHAADVIEFLLGDLEQEEIYLQDEESEYCTVGLLTTEEDDEDDDNSRMDRYYTAYIDALESDQQGYIVPATMTARHHSACSQRPRRSWQELAAVSWAAYCTNDDLVEDASYRLHALTTHSVTERLNFAMQWLCSVKQEDHQDERSNL